jgi:DNA-binding transcriptional LysR family regulator
MDIFMAISLRKLEIFTAVARLGSVTQAAKQLLLSQSAVSMALADLENHHNGALFIRRGRTLILNDRGKLLLPLAEEIIEQAANFTKYLETSAQEPTGELKIGASTTIGIYLLPLLVANFSKQYPKARITMQVGNTEVISTSLAQGKLDLALIEGPCHIDKLRQTRWFDDRLVIIAAPSHPWVNKGIVTQKKLQKEKWIMREAGSGTREVFEHALGLPLQQLKEIIELGHTEAIKKAVEAGLGVSCLSQLAVQRELDLGVLVAIPTDLDLTRSLTLLLPDSEYQSPLLKAGLAMLQSTQK